VEVHYPREKALRLFREKRTSQESQQAADEIGHLIAKERKFARHDSVYMRNVEPVFFSPLRVAFRRVAQKLFRVYGERDPSIKRIKFAASLDRSSMPVAQLNFELEPSGRVEVTLVQDFSNHEKEIDRIIELMEMSKGGNKKIVDEVCRRMDELGRKTRAEHEGSPSDAEVPYAEDE
jgi:hypothetical protein